MSNNKILKDLLSEKLINIVSYLRRLDIQKEAIDNEEYIKLLNEEIDFYKNKLCDYSILLKNI